MSNVVRHSLHMSQALCRWCSGESSDFAHGMHASSNRLQVWQVHHATLSFVASHIHYAKILKIMSLYCMHQVRVLFRDCRDITSHDETKASTRQLFHEVSPHSPWTTFVYCAICALAIRKPIFRQYLDIASDLTEYRFSYNLMWRVCTTIGYVSMMLWR